MAGYLYNRGSKPGRYNSRDDMQTLLQWIEDLREVNGSDDEAKDGTIFICGTISLAEVNRIRGAIGMAALEPSPEVNEDIFWSCSNPACRNQVYRNPGGKCPSCGARMDKQGQGDEEPAVMKPELKKDHRPATEGAYEVFWRSYSESGGIGEGFDRCCHAHATATDAGVCYRNLDKTLRDRPGSAEQGVRIGRTHIHPGGPWHEVGEVVLVDELNFAQLQQALGAERGGATE